MEYVARYLTPPAHQRSPPSYDTDPRKHGPTLKSSAQNYSSGLMDYTVKALVGPNKYLIDALPDTGAKRNFISQRLVKRLGLVPKDTTAGIVHGATWQFRSSWDKVTCDFYVLDNLKADIVLSSQFVFEHNVFSEFEEDIVDTSLVPGPDFGDIYNIRLISHYSSALQNLEASAIADMNSPSSFSPEAIKNERVRRDQIRDAIIALPLDQQDQARIDERNRQEIWDGYRRRHFEMEGGPIFVTQQVVVDWKQRRWRNRPFWSRLKKRVTKSMLWL
ncbi:uncharacterized protein FRV6_15664 [Fusarium oxysporum]|uniref:Uncharacterized protein n=1 Tax=Fusarium oxysporum TaxID=5507 RepID=A0A2H3U848_FUSOX|nr:uncharacterized protein FRV6_15664 [Fusarium oxysporum]